MTLFQLRTGDPRDQELEVRLFIRALDVVIFVEYGLWLVMDVTATHSVPASLPLFSYDFSPRQPSRSPCGSTHLPKSDEHLPSVEAPPSWCPAAEGGIEKGLRVQSSGAWLLVCVPTVPPTK